MRGPSSKGERRSEASQQVDCIITDLEILALLTIPLFRTEKKTSFHPDSNQEPIDNYSRYSQPLYQLSYRRAKKNECPALHQTQLKIAVLLFVFVSLLANISLPGHVLVLNQVAFESGTFGRSKGLSFFSNVFFMLSGLLGEELRV